MEAAAKRVRLECLPMPSGAWIAVQGPMMRTAQIRQRVRRDERVARTRGLGDQSRFQPSSCMSDAARDDGCSSKGRAFGVVEVIVRRVSPDNLRSASLQPYLAPPLCAPVSGPWGARPQPSNVAGWRFCRSLDLTECWVVSAGLQVRGHNIAQIPAPSVTAMRRWECT